jgi:hypothetical protein
MDYPILPVDADGYVSGLRCPHPHGGNTRFVQDGGHVTCQGCGHLALVADLVRTEERYAHLRSLLSEQK